MQPFWKLAGVMALGLVVAGGILFASDGPVEPGKHYLEDDVQFFSPGPDVRLAGTSKEDNAVLGDLLFTDVVAVHFTGPGHPANPDGSLGGLVAGNDGTQITIYERYIVMDSPDADGTTLRMLHAYETLGRIQQRLPNVNAKRGEN